jgi:hypothetical protein
MQNREAKWTDFFCIVCNIKEGKIWDLTLFLFFTNMLEEICFMILVCDFVMIIRRCCLWNTIGMGTIDATDPIQLRYKNGYFLMSPVNC